MEGPGNVLDVVSRIANMCARGVEAGTKFDGALGAVRCIGGFLFPWEIEEGFGLLHHPTQHPLLYTMVHYLHDIIYLLLLLSVDDHQPLGIS